MTLTVLLSSRRNLLFAVMLFSPLRLLRPVPPLQWGRLPGQEDIVSPRLLLAPVVVMVTEHGGQRKGKRKRDSI